jgi:hypothetical protein
MMIASSGQATADSAIPEFIDTIPDQLPILYIRANVGAPHGINQTYDPTYQYSYEQLKAYGSNFVDRAMPTKGTWQPFNQIPTNPTPDSDTWKDWVSYFLQQDVNTLNPKPTAPTMTPRGKDGFILISAGLDRTYGTKDDYFVTQ